MYICVRGSYMNKSLMYVYLPHRNVYPTIRTQIVPWNNACIEDTLKHS